MKYFLRITAIPPLIARQPEHGPILIVAAWVAACFLSTGCSQQKGEDLNFARTVLITSLDAWKTGAVPGDLSQRQPRIVVGDDDWERGRKLLDYKIQPHDVFDGRNLRVPVTLTLQRPHSSHQLQVNVTYVVCVTPAVTVFREE